MAALPNNGVNYQDSTNGHRLDYEVTFTTPGTYTIWVRMLGPTGNDDSLHVGLNGTPASYGRTGLSVRSSAWNWTNTVRGRAGADEVTVTVPSPGAYTVNAWIREDGAAIDSIIVTNDMNYRPNGIIPIDPPVQWLVDAGGNQTAPAAPDAFPTQLDLIGQVQPGNGSAVVVTEWQQVSGPTAMISNAGDLQTSATFTDIRHVCFCLTSFSKKLRLASRWCCAVKIPSKFPLVAIRLFGARRNWLIWPVSGGLRFLV